MANQPPNWPRGGQGTRWGRASEWVRPHQHDRRTPSAGLPGTPAQAVTGQTPPSCYRRPFRLAGQSPYTRGPSRSSDDQEERPMEGRVTYMEFPSKDIDRAQQFWNGVLGWEFGSGLNDEFDYRMAQVSPDSAVAISPGDDRAIRTCTWRRLISTQRSFGFRNLAARRARSERCLRGSLGRYRHWRSTTGALQSARTPRGTSLISSSARGNRNRSGDEC
jgi:hypothetical protein